MKLKAYPLVGFLAALAIAIPTLPAQAVTQSTSGNQVTQAFSYTNTLETWTVPAGVSEVTVSMYGSQGARGGNDASGRPPAGGYRGYVTGTLPVSEGQVLTFAVGGGAVDSSKAPSCSAGSNSTSGDAAESVSGKNPLAGFDGGNGGSAGPNGCSGYGGGGGAASVIQIGDGVTADSAGTVVAGGSGGSGGSGQFWAVVGRISFSEFVATTDSPATTNGQKGLYTKQACLDASWGSCDGGGGSGGGGGWAGGIRGVVEFGSGSSTEWFGYGASPGQNWNANISSLTTGYEYYSTNNAAGSISISYSSGTPSSPTGLTATAGNTTADIYWTAPSNPGLTAISGYKVEYASGPSYSSWTAFPGCTSTAVICQVTGLVNATDYKFRVSAINSIGTGNASALSSVVTPAGAPATPTISGITPGDGSLSVAFSAPASSFAITDYEYTLDAGATWLSSGSSSSPLTVPGLLNGTVYSVSIRAVSSAGASSGSVATNATPSAVPGAPTMTSVVAGGDGTSLVVTFVEGFTGGSAITDFEYATSIGENTSSFGAYTSAGTASPFTITGLASGTVYTVQLRAKNTAGSGPSSAFQTGVTLAAPTAPAISSIVSGAQKLTITYGAYSSANDGGSAISKVEYSLDDGVTWADSGTLSNPFVVSGLVNGQSYSVKLRAINAIGVSSASLATVAIPAAIPAAPQIARVSSAEQSVTVTWDAPSSDGGSVITSYKASAYSASSGGASVQSCSTATLTCSITGLTNGSSYYISVTATNAIGESAESAPRILGLPAAAPGAPTISSIAGGSNYLSVAFTAGTQDANAPITGYQFSTDNGDTWNSSLATSSPLLISGLTNGTSYQVKLRANSSVGYGAASAAGSGKPVSSPDAVASSSIGYTAASGSVTISWTAPNDNGSAITNYEVSAFNADTAGSKVSSCTTTGATSCTISSLANGTNYYVSIQAQNAISYSSRSTPRVQVKPGNSISVLLASSSAGIQVGASVTLTATLSNSAATGTVNFLSGSSSITGCSAQAVSVGVATCVTTSLAAGNLQIRANYSGDATYSSSISSAEAVAVSALVQTISFAAIADAPISGGGLTLSATGGASGNPVTFSSATTSVCTTGAVNGATVTLIADGLCTINANQLGNSNYGAASTVQQSFNVYSIHTVSFDSAGGSADPVDAVFSAGSAALSLPTVTKTSFVFTGWYTAIFGGTLIGDSGDSFTPSTTQTLHAQWTQLSLWGMGSSTKIGTLTTVSGVGASFIASGSGNNVRIDYEADSLPPATVMDVYLLASTTRAEALVSSSSKDFIVSLVVAWLAADGTVPDTAAGKPLNMTITNAQIKSGAVVYSILGSNITQLGTATQDGVVTVAITSDPEIAIANLITSSAPASSGGGGSTAPAPTKVAEVLAPKFDLKFPGSQKSMVTEDGLAASTKTALDSVKGDLSFVADTWEMKVSTSTNQGSAKVGDPLIIESDAPLVASGRGFKADSIVMAFLSSVTQSTVSSASFSFQALATYIDLGEITVGSTGEFEGALAKLDLAPGLYLLQVNGLSPDDLVRSISMEILIVSPQSKGWTKKVSNSQVKIYFKNPIGVGKLQFYVNGREIAWIRATDESDPKLRVTNIASYMVRTVRLVPGQKNALEIYLDGERIWRAAYAG